jgi:hypothetical protein
MKYAALLSVAFCLAFSAAIGVVAAQDAAQPTAPEPQAAPAKPAKAKPAKPADWTGTWSGSLAQVGRAKPFAFELTLSGKTGATSYPDDHCTGKLARAGTSGGFAFFTETITEGKVDPATRKGCLDGTLTMVKDEGGSLIMTWMAAYGGKAIVAYGTLAPKQ